jgi:hypothetical protein
MLACGQDKNQFRSIEPEIIVEPELIKVEGCLEVLADNTLELESSIIQEENGSCQYTFCPYESAQSDIKQQYDDYKKQFPDAKDFTNLCSQSIKQDFSDFEWGRVSIVWVVDNSWSMHNKQVSLAENFEKFIQDFVESEHTIDQFIVTTDEKVVDEAIPLLSSNAFKQDKDLYEKNFKKYIKVGIDGSNDEKVLKSAARFFENYAGSYIDPESFVAIIALSDEHEQSGGNPEGYIEEFKKYVDGPERLTFHSIINFRKDRDDRFKKTAQSSNGLYLDINSPDFGKILKQLGEYIASKIGEIKLTQSAYLESIKVYVNGARFYDWKYDEQKRQIFFDSNANPPRKGDKLEVEYTPKI